MTEDPTKQIFALPFHPHTDELISSVLQLRTDGLDNVLAKRKGA